MDMIDVELAGLGKRFDNLKERIIPDFENRTEMLYS
jgi:hypothetical protein